MRLREAFSSPSLTDIIYSCPDPGDRGAHVKKTRHHDDDDETQPHVPGRRYPPVDRSLQGAALSGYPNVPLDTQRPSLVNLSPLAPRPVASLDAPLAPKDIKTMHLTLKGLNKKGTTALYAGALGAVRISIAAFVNKTAPAVIDVADGIFAVKTPKTPKVKLTKEERAALPKPTEAERIAKMEERLAKARAKLAAAQNEL